MKKNLLLLFFYIACYSTYGQLNNQIFEQRKPIVPSDSNALFLGIKTLGFTKNNEYFNDIADGYTLFGYQMNPYLSYMPTRNFIIEAGIFLQKDFGSGGYENIVPTFSMKYSHGNAMIIFGNLEGSLSHRLIEPLYDFEKVMVDRPETGVQLLLNTDRVFVDGWVDWQNMIYKGDPEQEQVTGGLSVDYNILQRDHLELSVPFQFLVMHKGGQIDSSPAPLQTLTNTAAGFSLKQTMKEGSFIKYAGMQHYYVYYKDHSGERLQAFEDGSGWYLNAEVRTRHEVGAMVSYWKGHEFMSIMGGQLYPSVSSTFKNNEVIEPERELVILRLMHDIKITDRLTIGTRVEPFYDLGNNSFEFSHGFYINYSDDFFLVKKKNRQ